MPAPVISPLTSVLAPFVGESFAYQPAATNAPASWKEIIPQFAFTVNSGTDVVTFTGVTLANGDRVRVISSTTLPAPLVQGAYYFVRDVSGSTCKLALTLGGAAIDLTTTGTGTHYLARSAFPPGLNFDLVTGLISGTPIAKGFYQLTLVATNDFLQIDFTAANATDERTLGTAGTSTLVNGDTVRVSTNGTLPAPLAIGTDYFIRDLASGVFKLSATAGGAAINLTTDGVGTHRIGRVADGDSASLIFPIGVRESRGQLGTAIGLTWDWDTGLIYVAGGSPSSAAQFPQITLKNGDQLIFAVQFVRAGQPFHPDVQDLVCGIKIEDEEALVLLTDGTFAADSTAPDARFFFILDTTVVPSGGTPVASAIEEIADTGPDIAPAWLELRVSYDADPLGTGSATFYRAARVMPVQIERSLIA